MGTIAQELTRIQTAKADIKSAIEAKGVTVGSSLTLDDYSQKIAEIPTGSSVQEAEENDVNFYDYDGFRVASFTIAEAKALTQAEYNAILPPTHEGLTFQEWNWTWNDITTYNRRYIDIGANYVTSDGKTHINIYLAQAGDFAVGIWSTSGKKVTIDWGDGSASEEKTLGNVTNYYTHSFSTSGFYDITITHSTLESVPYYGIRFSTNDSDLINSESIQEINLGSLVFGFNFSFVNFRLSVSKNILVESSSINARDCVISNGFITPCIVFPRNTSHNFRITNQFYYMTTTLCLPKQVTGYTGTRIFNRNAKTTHIVLPEYTNNDSVAVLTDYTSATALSIPSSLKLSNAGNFSNFINLRHIDIVAGWIPNQNLTFSASTAFIADDIVDFFNKLGTTTNAITLTFGSTNLDKLTADQKAIATNKGYTLA